MARLWRVHHPGLSAVSGEIVELDPNEAHHVHRVLRLGPGDAVAVFDGRGAEWRAIVEISERDRVSVRLEVPVASGPVDPPIEIVLYQGLCRPDKMDWLVQKATEIGVSAILPFEADRTGPHAVTERRLARWRRIAIEAAKQCGRRQVPLIERRDALPRPRPPDQLALVLDPVQGGSSLGEVCERPAGPPRCVWLAVGPEGGFEREEVAALAREGWHPVVLGPRTLRADTAGIVAASILLHRWGDLGPPAPAIVDSPTGRP